MTKTILQTAKAQEKQRRKNAQGRVQPDAKTLKNYGRAPDVNKDPKMLSSRELGQGFRQMAPAGGALVGGMGVALGASGGAGLSFGRSTNKSSSGRNPNPGFAPGFGPPSQPRVPYRPPSAPSSGGSSAPTSTPGVVVVTAPVVYGSQKHGTSPKMWAKANKGDVVVTVEHTEYLKDIVGVGSAVFPSLNGTGSFQVFANPAQDASFPWLSTLAANFDEYKFDYLEVSYEPSVGTDTDGKLLLTFDPDVLDEFPNSKQEMLEARVQLDAVPWQHAKLNVPKDLLSDWRYCRSGDVPEGADQHVYDTGVFNLATPGAPSGMIGEFFISYKVRLRTPNGGQAKGGHGVVVGATLAAPLGTSITYNDASTINVQWSSGTKFFFKTPGTYMLTMYYVGTTITAAGSIAADDAVNVCNNWQNAFTATNLVMSFEIIAATSGTFTITPPTAATITANELVVTDWDVDFDI